MTHALGQLRFESIVLRVPFVKHSSYRAEVRIDRIQRTAKVRVVGVCHKRPHISRRSLSRDNEVGVIHPEWLMDAPRAYIGDHGGQTRGKLLLHVEIPLHHVVAFGTGVNICGPQSVGGKLRRLAVKIGKRIRTSAKYGGILNHSLGEELNCLRNQERELIMHGLNGKNADTAPDRSFPVLEWIPCTADTRLKILQLGIVKKWIPQVRQC